MQQREHVSLAELCALRLGGEARYVLEPKNSVEIQGAVQFAKARGLPYAILGGGGAVLPADQGFDGVVIRLIGDRIKENVDEQTVFAGATLPSGSSIGAAVVDNEAGIGALLKTMTVVTDQGTTEMLLPDVCHFGEHRSVFQTAKMIIASVTGAFQSLPSSNILPANGLRLFFDRPDKPAQQIIRELGLAERRLGGIQLWRDDPAVAINDGTGTAEQVVQLMSLVKQQARDTLQIQLRDAVHYLGF